MDSGFEDRLADAGVGPLTRGRVTTLQINVGKRCNQACVHCHVDAGPARTESMSDEVAERCMWLLERTPSIDTVDITGGAPELHPRFRWLVTRSLALGRGVIDRCNLTILTEPGQWDLAPFLADHGVRVVASLPCYSSGNVDAQRGAGVFTRSIEGLKRLNAAGYAMPGSDLALDLIYNPGGPFLPPPQRVLEERYRQALLTDHGIHFSSLLTLTNLPISRFNGWLARRDATDSYQQLLEDSFNPATVPALMCRSTVSVGYTGALYDCDFNQMLEVGMSASHIDVFDVQTLERLPIRIATGSHCFGCTAGAGSSCGGALT